MIAAAGPSSTSMQCEMSRQGLLKRCKKRRVEFALDQCSSIVVPTPITTSAHATTRTVIPGKPKQSRAVAPRKRAPVVRSHQQAAQLDSAQVVRDIQVHFNNGTLAKCSAAQLHCFLQHHQQHFHIRTMKKILVQKVQKVLCAQQK